MPPLCRITVEATSKAKETLCYGVLVKGVEEELTIYIECYLKTTNGTVKVKIDVLVFI